MLALLGEASDRDINFWQFLSPTNHKIWCVGVCAPADACVKSWRFKVPGQKSSKIQDSDSKRTLSKVTWKSFESKFIYSILTQNMSELLKCFCHFSNASYVSCIHEPPVAQWALEGYVS